MTGGDDLYRMLGVDPSASTSEIASGFSTPPTAGEARDAYDILGDPARRRSYDDTRRARTDAASAAETSQHQAPADGADVELRLSFDQAALGTTATVHVETPTRCSACAGTAVVAGPACVDCGGVGFHTRSSGGINIRTECRSCRGTGGAAPTACGTCDGRGVVAATRALTLRLPPGVDDGARIRFDVRDGAASSQRHAIVRVAPHRYFTRDGADLRVSVPITIAEAALGGAVTVPTLGGAVAIRIPPGTSSGRTFRIRGRGIPAASGAGDLLAKIDVVIPTALNEQQRRALELFSAASESPRGHFAAPAEDVPDAP